MSQPEFYSRSTLGNRHRSEDTLPGDTDDRSGQVYNGIDYSTLLRELMQLQHLEEERVARIYHLEQALDQALLCIEELRGRVREQGILESQLAATEEFASIQQKAIARLRLQMEQQQQLIERTLADGVDANEHHALLQEMVGMMKAIASQQEQEIEQFQSCQSALQCDIEAHAQRLEAENNSLQTSLDQRGRQVLALEAEVLAAHSQAVRLQAELEAVTRRLHSLQAEGLVDEPSVDAHDSRALLDPQDLASEAPSAPPLAPAKSKRKAGLNIPPDLSQMQAQIEELELQLSKQFGAQARWQQRCLELEAESQRYQMQAGETQQQIAEMQEEILRQTKQSGEYEAAIQHWKDRHRSNQRTLIQIQDLLKSALPYALAEPPAEDELNPVLLEVLDTIQSTLRVEEDDALSPHPLPASRFNTLDLPDFLIRRRNYRKKIQSSASEPEQYSSDPSAED